jgi:hypothetical protein
MSVEAFDPGVSTPEVIELFGAEALIARRRRLQAALGEASVELVRANQAYNQLIQDIIQTNTAIREQGMNPDEVMQQLEVRYLHED